MKRPPQNRAKKSERRKRTFLPELENLEYRWYPGDILVPLAWTALASRFQTLFGDSLPPMQNPPRLGGEYRRADGIMVVSEGEPSRIAVVGERQLTPEATSTPSTPAAKPTPEKDSVPEGQAIDSTVFDPLANPWDAPPAARKHAGQADAEPIEQSRLRADGAAPLFEPVGSPAESAGSPTVAYLAGDGYRSDLGSWSHLGSSTSTPAAPRSITPEASPPHDQGGPLTGSSEPRWQGPNYAQLPLGFEPNRGQTGAAVQFLSRGQGYNLFLTATGTTVVLQKPVTPDPTRAVLRLQLAGANPAAQGTALDPLPGARNYFKGSDPRQWQTNVPHYSRVSYHNVYPGIDLAYYGNQRQMEFDFVVAPGSSPAAIHLAFDGAAPLTLNPQGDLVLGTPGGNALQRAPVIYQLANGARQPVTGSYVLQSASQAGFTIGSYDASRPLYIDPVLSYSGYLGGSGADNGNAIAVDATGNAYIAGSTTSPDFPGAGGLQSYGGNGDAARAAVSRSSMPSSQPTAAVPPTPSWPKSTRLCLGAARSSTPATWAAATWTRAGESRSIRPTMLTSPAARAPTISPPRPVVIRPPTAVVHAAPIRAATPSWPRSSSPLRRQTQR